MQEENLSRIIELRHRLHKHPELSLQEKETKKTLMKFLQTYTSLQLTDRGDWFYACYEGAPGAEVIGVRADMDALPIPEEPGLPYASEVPGVSHRCGHDGHCAALAGLALELEASGCDKTVYLIFQHAEEIGAGGEVCAELIEEKKISRIYAFHNWSGFKEGGIVLMKGIAQCASKGYIVSFTGRTAHASRQEDGINPSAAIAKLVLYMREAVEMEGYGGPVWATLVEVSAGTGDFGIAASTGHVSATLRAGLGTDLERLTEVIRQKAVALAGEENLSVSFAEQDVFPDTVNDAQEVERVRREALRLGYPIIEREEPIRAAEDFGHYLKHCPGAMIYIGNGENYPHIHTIEYDFNDTILETAVDLFCGLAQN